MKTRLILITLTLLALVAGLERAAALGTEFTYQGRLNEASSPVIGSYDFTFTLHLTSSGGTPIVTVTNLNVAMSNGLFTTAVDFGSGIYNGNAYWIQLGVRSNGSGGSFTALTPRQPLTPTPNAHYATLASTVPGGSITATKLAVDSISNQALQNNAVTAAKVAAGQVVKSLNNLRDNVTLSAGPNVKITPSGNTLTIAGEDSGSISVRDFGALGNWNWGNQTGADDTVAIQAAIDYASALGLQDSPPPPASAVVYLPAGTYRISQTLRLPNRVRLRGDNGRNTQIHANPGFTNAFMFHARNEDGNFSMFHSRIEELCIRVHGNTNIQAVIKADAWQENSGLSRVVITEFTKYGVELEFGYGGAASLLFEHCEIFAADNAVTNSAGIYVHQISSVAAFLFCVNWTTIAGASALQPLTYGIFMENDTLVARALHFENVKNGVRLQQNANGVLDALTGSFATTSAANLVFLGNPWTGFLSGRGLMPNGFQYTLWDSRSSTNNKQGNLADIVLK